MVAQNTPMIEVALAHAAKGWHVFPLSPGAKTPLIPKSDGGNGFKDATTDEAKIRAWWEKEPRANVGIATGKVSGIDVLDVDGPAGEDTAKRLAKEFGGFGATLRVKTRRGWHIYFRHLDGLKSKARILGPDSGLDTRGDGGYVVAPGSTVEGVTYIAHEAPLGGWPDWICPHLPRKGVGKHETSTTHGAIPNLEGFTPYGRAAFAALCHELQSARHGSRNETLNRLAFRAGQLHAAGETPNTLDTLIGFAPVGEDFTITEATKTATGAFEAGARSPRGAPPRSHRKPQEALGQRTAEGADEPPEPEGGETVPEDGPSSAQAAEERLTDLGNARRLVRMFGKDILYTSTHGWFVWDGTRWAKDDLNRAHLHAKAAVESLWEDVRYAEHDARKPLIRHADASQSQRAIQACLALASSEPGIATRHSDFDQHPGLVNAPNGVLELATGILHPHDKALRLTKTLGVPYDAKASCPRWLAFLDQVLPDPEVRGFVQRYAGYSLSGAKNEQCFAFLYGTGSNGKSTFIDVLCHVFGEYALSTPFDTFLARQAGQASNDLARLAGARLVRASEPDDGVTLSESVIKQATGGEPISARFLHKEFFEFLPEFALWLSGNHQPRVKGTDHGIWRRIHLVPFTVRFDKPDTTLKDALFLEAPGILAWCVAGFSAYRSGGLQPPSMVKDATAEYRRDQDTLGQFLEDRCVLGVEQHVTVKHLRSVYKDWCEEMEEFVLSQRRFKARLAEHGVAQMSNGAARFWKGIGVKAGVEQGRYAD